MRTILTKMTPIGRIVEVRLPNGKNARRRVEIVMDGELQGAGTLVGLWRSSLDGDTTHVILAGCHAIGFTQMEARTIRAALNA